MMRALLLSLALLLVAMPLADAQGPNTTSCGVTVASTTPDNAVAGGGDVSVTVTATNTGNLPVNATIAATFAASDTGWHVAPPSQSVTAQPGSKATALFTVTADKGAKSSASLNFATTAACSGPNPALPCPIPQSCTAQGNPLTVQLNAQAPSGFHIPGLDALGFPIEYLVAGIVLIIVTLAIVLLLRRRTPAGAMLSCPEPLKFVKAGRGASFPIEVRNAADKPARLGLAVGAVPEGWSAFLPLPEIQLAAKETRGLWLMVRAPETAKTGDAIDVDILATDPAAPNKPKKVRVRAEVTDTGAASS